MKRRIFLAKKPEENQLTTAFVEEVEEDLRQEKIKKIWRRFGPPAAVLAVLIVLGVFSWSFYTNSVEQKARDVSDQFLGAMELFSQGQDEQSRQILTDIEKSGVKGYEFSALLAVAYQHLEQGDITAALAAYDKIINGNYDKIYQNLALILAAQSALGTDYYASYEGDIEKIAASNLALKWIAREVKALNSLSLNDNEAAKLAFEDLANNPEIPNDIRGRAQLMLENIK